MRLIRSAVLAMVAVFAFGAVAASAASATEILFDAGAVGATFTSKGGVSTLVKANGKTVECAELTNTGKLTDQHLGTVVVTFEKCTAKEGGLTATCTSTGATSGHIVAELEFHLGLAEPGDVPAILLQLTKTVVFKCTVFGIGPTIEVKGSVIGKLKKSATEEAKLNEPEATAFLELKAEGSKQDYKTFVLSLGGGTMENVHLESNEEGGTFEESGQNTNDTMEKFSSGTIELVEG